MTRRAFIERNGATCRNWTWSWSFVNEEERFVIFGAWDWGTQGDRAIILADDWVKSRKGKTNPGFNQARRHIRLIEEQGYALKTFPIYWDDERQGDEPSKIAAFTPELTDRRLQRRDDGWYAVPI